MSAGGDEERVKIVTHWQRGEKGRERQSAERMEGEDRRIIIAG